MVQVTYEVKGLNEILAKVNAPASLLGPPIRTAFSASALLVEGEAKKLVPTDTSNLRRTITHKVDTAPIPLFAEVGTNAAYGKVVHDGRGAGKPAPPVSALKGWASRHGIPASAVFLVARAIGRRGIKGRPFLANALKAMTGQIDAAFAKAAREIESRWGGR